MRHAEVRYAEHDGDYLAFTVFGEGPTDLVIPLNRFPIDLIWERPHLATFMEALGRLARVITWDGRGFGASDPILDRNRVHDGGFRRRPARGSSCRGFRAGEPLRYG